MVGKGFTEWTNVGKAKPLFKGHYQPRVPADLGYYDLRLPCIREQQVELAKEAGITAFCYWYYWFGNGKRVMTEVIDDIINSGKPDFPYCLGWANHSWYAKTWTADVKDKLLLKQTYPGVEDAQMHFNYLLKAFKDPRYLKINGKPFLYIFEDTLPTEYISWFRQWAKEAGFNDLFIVGRQIGESIIKYEGKNLLEAGYDAVTFDRLSQVLETEYRQKNFFTQFYNRILRRINALLFKIPRHAVDYSMYYHFLIDKNVESRDNIIPIIVPQWDHSPRSGKHAYFLMYNSTPKSFYFHVKEALATIKNKPEDNQILILKSWNEWGEGNYMEPDLKYGKEYIYALKKAIDELKK